MLTLAGGLGNQLFQLAAGLYIEKTLNRRVLYNVTNLNEPTDECVPSYARKFEIADLIDDKRLINSRFPIRLDMPKRYIRRLTNPQSVLHESDLSENVFSAVSKRTIAIYGYFQNYNLVEASWPELEVRILNSLKFAPLLKGPVVARIALHLRFGDYSDDPVTKAAHGLTSPSYYKEALEYISNHCKSHLDVLVISDNREKAASFLKFFDLGNRISILENGNPLDDFVEIAKSSHVIMSNSTFSWWASWFAHKKHQSCVIYPRPWFANNLDPSLPLFVPEWTAIKRDYEV